MGTRFNNSTNVEDSTSARLTQNPCYGQFYRRKLISLCGTMWLKANNLYHLKDNIIKSKAEIPNVEGFEFIGVLNDGSCVDCVVRKDDKGLHYIDNFKNIIGWVS